VDQLASQHDFQTSARASNLQVEEDASVLSSTSANASNLQVKKDASAPKSTTITRMDLMSSCQAIIEPSAWNLPLFIGMHNVSLSESILATFLMFMNIALQSVLCFIIHTAFQPEHLDLEQARQWRWSVGHALKYSNTTGHSLTQRMCGESSIVEMSSQLSGTLAADIAYADPLMHDKFPVGAVLSFICILLWFFFLWEEFQSMARLWRGLARLPRFGCSQLTHVGKGTPAERLALISITHARFTSISLSLLARLITVCFLSYAGTIWLAHEANLQELLLNCSALTLILQVDEILFKSMGPVTMQCIIHRLEPLVFRGPDKGWDATLRPIFKILCTIAFMVWCVYFHVSLTAQAAKDFTDALCGGNTDFTVANQFTTGLALALNGTPGSAKAPPSVLAAKYLATGSDSYDHVTVSSFADLQLQASWTIEEYHAMFGQCTDVNSTANKPVWAALRNVLGRPELSSCIDLPHEACWREEPIIRIACPVRCGCRAPIFGTFLLKGCDLMRCSATKEYSHARAQIRTTDPHPEVLHGRRDWHAYWHSFEVDLTNHMERNTLRLTKKQVKRIRMSFSESGCDAFADLLPAEPWRQADFLDFFCTENTQRRPLRPFCPGTCECLQRGRSSDLFCPPPIPAASCPGIWVITNAAALGCGHALPSGSSPFGVYHCHYELYNRKHLYNLTDGGGVVWTIRFETVEHLDWGAMFLGLSNLSNASKWVLEAHLPGTSNSSYQHFMMSDGRNGLSLPHGTWLPCTGNSADGGLVTRNLSSMLVNKWSKKCLTLVLANMSAPSGAPWLSQEVRMDSCENIGTQLWFFHGQQIKSNYWSAKCLEHISNASSPNRFGMALANCKNHAEQSFQHDGNGYVRLGNDDSKCLTYHMKHHDMVVSQCESLITQQWYLIPASTLTLFTFPFR